LTTPRELLEELTAMVPPPATAYSVAIALH
jgi:hypothetical protein